MPYRLVCERSGADSLVVHDLADDLNTARDKFNRYVAMAVQHGEWHKVQVIPLGSPREPDPRPIMAYNSHGIDVEYINEDANGTYRWVDERGTTWLRPTAHAYMGICVAYNRLRYGDAPPTAEPKAD